MKKKKINIIIQARMGSTRLPGKVLLPIMGRPMLSYLIERLRYMRTIDSLIIATTTHPQDDVIESFCQKENIKCFRGSENDVLDRYYQAACQYPSDLIVRITSDCPLMDPTLINQALTLFSKKGLRLDYVSNTQLRTFPRGMDIEIFSFHALETANQEATSRFDREHVTPYIYKHLDLFHLANFSHMTDISQYRLTVDTPEDFLLITKIFETLYPTHKHFTLQNILDAFDKHPEWKTINAHIKQKKE